MFDVGFWELLVIALIALIVLGPERLPELARTIGLWLGRARAAFYSVQQEVEREINAEKLRETRRALQREMKERTRAVAKAAGITNAANEQAPLTPSADEERAAAEPAPANEREGAPPRADPPASQNSTPDEGGADATKRNTGR